MNNFKFSSTVTYQYDTPFSAFKTAEFDDGLKWLVDSGFDAAEICISNYENVDVNQIKAKLDALKLGCSTLSTGQARGLENISLLHEGEAMIKAQKRLIEHINAAKVLGSKVTIGLIRGLGTPGHEDEEKALLAQRLVPVIEAAETQGVTLILEAINRYETSLFNDAESTVDFIKNYLNNSKAVGVLWDVFHANIEDPSFEYALDKLQDKLKHVHIADSNRMFPGYGHTDFIKLGQLLKAHGFSDYLSFECFNKPSLEVVLKKSKDFVSEMKAI